MNTRVKQIHEASMIMLENVGIRLHHPEILDLLEDKGIRVKDGTAREVGQLMEMAAIPFGGPEKFKENPRGHGHQHHPCRCGGSSSDAAGVTAQSGWESMMAMFVSCSEKVDLILHSAGILTGYAAMSYEKFITDLEMIRLAASYFTDLETDENAMALDAVAEVGWQNQFLMHPHTMKKCREAAWVSDITPSGRGAAPDPAVLKQLNDYLLKQNVPPDPPVR